MISKDQASPPPRALLRSVTRSQWWLLLAALSIAATCLASWAAWRDAVRHGRARTVVEMVSARTPPRVTEGPGAAAWTTVLLQDYARRVPAAERAGYLALVSPSRDGAVPEALRPAAEALLEVLDGASSISLQALPSEDLPVPPRAPSLSLRSLELLRAASGPAEGEAFVGTRRRRLLEQQDPDSQRFFEGAAGVLQAWAQRARRGATLTQALPGLGAARCVRVYALGEDQSFLSLPLGQEGQEAARLAQEAEEFCKLPRSPGFASHEFFFQEFPGLGLPVRYSGPYLDLGGLGLVATLSTPWNPQEGFEAVLAIDLQWPVDWSDFLQDFPRPAEATRVSTRPASGVAGRPWTQLKASLEVDAPAALRAAVGRLAQQEGNLEVAAAPRRSQHHAQTEDGSILVALQVSAQVSAEEWLILYVPGAAPRWPWIAAALTTTVLALLLVGVERQRRRADRQRAMAERALSEKQSLLDTMQVPLVVVDPNHDTIVHGNGAAEALGLRAGLRFGDDLVADQAGARAHYHAMQIADSRPRRAYGVPLRLRSRDGEREAYALIRSIAVTAPIDTLHADPRHRLGIVFVLEEHADLDLYLRPVLERSRGEERARLGSLLDHGLDSLVRVLAASLAEPAIDARWALWLARYLERRVEVLQWLLEHWGRDRPSRALSLVGHAALRETLDQYREAFEHAAADPRLRARLHWSNGTLAGEGPPPFEAEVDWSDDSCVPLPVEGLLGFFVGEALINAIQHGRPGTTPRVRFHHDRARHELAMSFENSPRREARAPKSYGGLSLLGQVARLAGWTPLNVEHDAEHFRLSVRAPLARHRGD